MRDTGHLWFPLHTPCWEAPPPGGAFLLPLDEAGDPETCLVWAYGFPSSLTMAAQGFWEPRVGISNNSSWSSRESFLGDVV